MEPLFSLKNRFQERYASFMIIQHYYVRVIKTCLTLLGIIGLNSCQKMYHTQAQRRQNPSVWLYSCCFFPYFDYTLCINMEYGFISFVSFLCSLMGDGMSVGLCQEEGFLALPRYALLPLSHVARGSILACK